MSVPLLGVDLLIDGTWSSIAEDVRSDGVSIKRGRLGSPTSMNLNLRNTDGKYSPRNTRSPLFGKISRNTPIRCWVEMGGPRLIQDAGGSWDTEPADEHNASVQIDLRVDVSMRSWRPSTSTYIGVQKEGGYGLWTGSDGYLRILWWLDDGSDDVVSLRSTIPIPGGGTGRRRLRAHLVGDGGNGRAKVTFYYADTFAGPWLQLGAVVEHSTTVTFRTYSSGISTFTNDSCELYGLEVRTGPSNDLVASLYPGTYDSGVTTVTDGQGNVWSSAGSRSNMTNRHYRFVGEVTEWPQMWGPKGAPQAYSPIECSATLRRLGQGSAPVKSTLRRGIEVLPNLIGYWPLEDGDRATSLAVVKGTGLGRIVGEVSPAGYDGFIASEAIPTFSTGRVYLPLPPTTPTGAAQWRFLLRGGDDIPDGTVLARLGTSSSLGYIDVVYNASLDQLYINLYSNTGVLGLTTGTLGSVSVTERNRRYSVEVQQEGANVKVRLVAVEEGFNTGFFIESTKAGMTLGAPTYVWLNPASVDLGGTAIGHVSIESRISSVFDVAQEFAAYMGERADTRMLRLAAENGLSLAAFGAGGGCERMGGQRSKTLLALLTEAASTDGGLLYEANSDNALRYRTLESLWAQDPQLSLDFGDGSFVKATPIEDDRDICNTVTVTREGGGEYTHRVAKGPLSVADPPLGVGIYDDSRSLSLYSDLSTKQQAGWIAHMGTVDEARWPNIQIDLAHPLFQADPVLTRDALTVDLGDRIDVTDLPEWLPPHDVRQVVVGAEETIAAKDVDDRWLYRIEFECEPYSPYNVGVWMASLYETVTTTSPGTSYMTDSFAGSDGDPLGAAWSTGTTASGATATVQSGRARFAVGASGIVTRRISSVSQADGDVTFSYWLSSGDCFPEFVIRHNTTTLDRDSCYTIRIPSLVDQRLSIRRSDAYSASTLVNYAFTPTASTEYRIRILVDGSSIKAKVWAASGSEPAGWQVQVTDSTYTAAGNWGFYVGSNSVAGPYIEIDSFSWRDPDGATSTTKVPIASPPTAARWGSGSSKLDLDMPVDQTWLNAKVNRGPRWTTRIADLPLSVQVGGEVMTVTAIGAPDGNRVQQFTVTRGVNGIQKVHVVGEAIDLNEPAYWGARPRGGVIFEGGGDTGGGDTGSGGGGTEPNTVRIGSATYPLSGVDPGVAGGWGGVSGFPGNRGADQLIWYTTDSGATSPANQWGTEVPADGDMLVNSVNDRQATQDMTGTTIPSGGGVLSGHGAARDWLLANATPGALIELIYVTPSSGGGGTGGGDTGGGTGSTSGWPAFTVALYQMIYPSNAMNMNHSGCTQYRLAFGFEQGGILSLAGGTTSGLAALKAKCEAIRAAGGQIILSLGGAYNTVNTADRSGTIAEIKAAAAQVGGIDGIDWDIETGSTFPTADAIYISGQLKSFYGDGFGVTMAPNGTNIGAYLPAAVQLQNAGLLTEFGQQFYDAPVSRAAAEGRIQEALNAGIPASKYSVGMMLYGSVPGGYWDNPTSQSYMQYFRTTYGLRRCYMWESNMTGVGTWTANMRNIVQ